MDQENGISRPLTAQEFFSKPPKKARLISQRTDEHAHNPFAKARKRPKLYNPRDFD